MPDNRHPEVLRRIWPAVKAALLACRSFGRPTLLLATVHCLLATFALAAEPPTTAFERAASSLKFLAAADLLHDRFPDRINPAEDLQTHNKLLTDLFARNDSINDLLPLLQHNDPKVRTLAIAALCHTGDPKILPHLLSFCDDRAPTLPHPGLVAMTPGMEKDITPLEPQVVANFPRAILRQYLSAAGYNSVPADFQAYWSARKSRPFCASWFSVKLDRALQGNRSIPPNRAAQVQSLRDEINHLPPTDRAWTILYLSAADPLLFDAQACLAAAQSLGPPALLQTLQGKCPSPDPDLQMSTDRIDAIHLFILKHATQLLRPQDASVLLTLDRISTPWYAIAAANLQPQQSQSILTDAFARFPRQGYHDAWARSDLATALWQLQGTSSTDDLIRWFYSETLKDEGVPHSRARFLLSLDPHAPATRTLLAKLIHHLDFNTLDWSSLKALIPILNQWVQTPIVSPKELHDLQHPYGEQHTVQQPDQAAKTYPEQTPQLNQTLTTWRQKIQSSVPTWSSKTPNN
jgi:hypothetical protein